MTASICLDRKINRKYLDRQRFSSPSSISSEDYFFNKEKNQIKKAIDYIATLKDDWDGYDASAPDKAAVKMAKFFVTYLPCEFSLDCYIEPDGEGGINFVWKNDDCHVILTIDGRYLYISYDDFQNSPVFINDIPYYGEEFFPRKILRYIPKK